MDVICDAADSIAFTVCVANDRGKVRVELFCDVVVKIGSAIFGAEDDVY
jgi:hypothetical protein